MSLPTYDKKQRRQSFEQLPKGAYVLKILGAKEDTWNDGSQCIRIAFDISEGDHKNYFDRLFKARKANNEDTQWPIDGTFTLSVPNDNSEAFVWTNWNTFFADLEDSNDGFVFSGDLTKLKDKLIGGKFHIVQHEYKGNVYNNTRMKWTCVAEDVRQGKAGQMPKDKLISGAASSADATDPNGFMKIPDGAEEDFPF